jgi:transposase
MARHPGVFVRDLSMTEGQKLQRITRTAKDPVKLRRAIVVLMSGQGQAVSDIVELLQVDDGYVRDVIHAFNQRGFDALNPKWSGGRPSATDKTTRQKVVALAKTDPYALGLPFSCWSLVKLTAHLAREKITTVGREAIRRILRTDNVTFQTTTTWKPSNDPDFVTKMNRVLDLYDHPPADGRTPSMCHEPSGCGHLLRRVRTAEPVTPQGQSMAARRPTRPATGHLHPHPRGAAHARRPRSGHRPDAVPHPRPETMGRVLGPAQGPPTDLPRRAVVRDPGQLLPPQTR